MKIKTIDVHGKEWFDKINGNSYCAAQVTINFGMKSAKSYYCQFQYGYGDYYLQAAAEKLEKEGIIMRK